MLICMCVSPSEGSTDMQHSSLPSLQPCVQRSTGADAGGAERAQRALAGVLVRGPNSTRPPLYALWAASYESTLFGMSFYDLVSTSLCAVHSAAAGLCLPAPERQIVNMPHQRQPLLLLLSLSWELALCLLQRGDCPDKGSRAYGEVARESCPPYTWLQCRWL